MISIVCAYNNSNLLRDWLLNSLNTQTATHETILIDAAQYGFHSAAEALNAGGKKATGNYIMFVHQDVRLGSNSWLYDAEKILDTIPDLGIAGVAGSAAEGKNVSERTKNVIYHGDAMEPIGSPISSPEPVQTLDELLLIVPRDIFRLHQFDEATCSDWHLYGVDYCLTMQAFGKGVYAIPLFVMHKSKGGRTASVLSKLSFIYNFGLRKEFFYTLERVLKKHKENFMWIYTTAGYGKWKTSESLFVQRIKYSLIEMVQWVGLRIRSLFS